MGVNKRCWSHELLLVVVLLKLIITKSVVNATSTPSNGPIRFERRTNLPYSEDSGVVEIYYQDKWYIPCVERDTDAANVADVVCHQMGYTGAKSTSHSCKRCHCSYCSIAEFGLRVKCDRNDYLVILQCSISLSSCGSSSTSAVYVECYTSRLWDNPYNGQVRLNRNNTFFSRLSDSPNLGRVEIYCNGQWGTVCSNSFNEVDAKTVCRSLGYTESSFHSDTPSILDNSVPIWLHNVNCPETRRCITECEMCPTSQQNTSCSHYDDVYVVCWSPTDKPNSDFNISTCKYPDTQYITNATPAVGGIIGGIIGGLIGCGTLVLIIIVMAVLCKIHPSTVTRTVISTDNTATNNASNSNIGVGNQAGSTSVLRFSNHPPEQVQKPSLQSTSTQQFPSAPQYSELNHTSLTEVPPPPYELHVKYSSYSVSDEKKN